MQSNNNIIGKRINAALTLRGKKQKDLANYLQVKPNVVSYFCTGDRVPNVEQLRKIAKYLSVSSDYLIGLSENPTTDPDILNACKVTGLREPVIKHIKYLLDFLEKDYFAYALELLILGIDHSILFAIEDYCVSKQEAYQCEQYIIKKYCEKKKLNISGDDIEEKGLDAISDIFQQSACKGLIDSIFIRLNIDIEYKKYMISKNIQNIFLSIDDFTFSDEIIKKADDSFNIKKARINDIVNMRLKEAAEHGEHNPETE